MLVLSSKDELVDRAKQTAMKAKTYLIINWYQRSRTANRRPYVTFACEHGGVVKKYTKPILFTITVMLRLQDLRRSSCNRLSSSGKVMCRLVISYDFSENKTLVAQLDKRFFYVCSAQKIYNVFAKIKKNRIQGRNTVEEVLCLSAQRGYTVFYRNREESNVLSDIVVAYPTSMAMIRKWPYVLIMDTTYKTNKYNMPQFEAVGMTPTGKNFTMATAFMCNIQATTYRWVLQQIKHLYVTYAIYIDQNVLAKLTEMVKDEEVAQRFVNGSWNKLISEIDEEEYQRKLEVLKSKWQSRPDFLHDLFSTWLNPFAHKFCRVWTSQVLHFGVETMNRAESEHSMLKLWLSTCHGDLDTVFLNIDSLIEGQIA
ncbi:hypothetical protein M9H77_16201 [Catharanthus roseus]|uniref:Uncharacterized protein n=1 Tax=Catharanthus roseus TaxID=4058 RepID=A0ACC0B117_CATRO|nr:hypothetical protein M9H77_16201 [Catharanthus roseus]